MRPSTSCTTRSLTGRAPAGLEAELLRQHLAQHVGRRALDLQPHDRVDRALIELLLERLEQVAGAPPPPARDRPRG